MRNLLSGELPAQAQLAVRATLLWNQERWEVTVHVAYDGHAGTREVAVADCAEAAEFVAVAVVLAVDPALAQGTPWGEQASTRHPEQNVTEEAPQDGSSAAPAPNTDPGNAESDALLPETAIARRPRRIRMRGEGKPAGALRLRPHATLGAEGAWGALPGPRVGPSGAIGFDAGRWALSLGAHWFPPVTTRVPEAEAQVDFSLVAARLGAAYYFLGPRLRLGPSLALVGGALRAQQDGSRVGRVHEPWLSVAGGVQGAVQLVPVVSVLSGLELDVPLNYPTFVLSDGTRVDRIGVGARAQLSLRVFLPQK